ncbi:alpha/beta hydrolase [Sphingobacterium sp. LRF_L2]|uniref:alpha/beta hydrolase n=1 Tax=Sphingobacterium sp. LRF_L2 TaxID=3369421 RepID=UPI003F5EF07E
MKKRISAFIFLIVSGIAVFGQKTTIPLWSPTNFPNSKGLHLNDSIANGRILQVGSPRLEAFFSSDQKDKHAAVLIIPGGGYSQLAYEVAGYHVAKWFNSMGMSAFVLEHRLPQSLDVVNSELAPIQDAQRAMRILRYNAEKWGIDRSKIGVFGTSAGGHLAATLSTYPHDVASVGDSLDQISYVPNFQILISPVVDMLQFAHPWSRDQLLGKGASTEKKVLFSPQLQIKPNTATAFIVHASNDKTVSPENSIVYYQALLKNNVSAALHLFTKGDHAISVNKKVGATGYWLQLCEAWLKEITIL